MHLNSNFICKDTILKEYRLVAMESFSIELEEAIAHKCTKQSCFQNVGEKAASSNSV